MKKIILFALGAITLGTLTSCDDFLNDNRFPLTSIVNNPGYWSEANSQLQVDRFIDEINSAYGTGGSANGTFYWTTLNDNQVASSFRNWDYTSVPGTNGNWTYTQVRGANYIIAGVRSNEAVLGTAKYRNFEGIARLIRAVAYYKLVRTFGDAVWESDVVDPADIDILYGPRTNRDIVMDSVLADLQYAAANITTDNARFTWSKDMARALISEVALYEGTFCKYRTQAENGYAPSPERASRFLTASAQASEQLLNSGRYSFTDNYQSIYNSTAAGGASPVDPSKNITAFSSVPEIIFGRNYDPTNGRHSLISYTCSSTTTSGMSLAGFKSFLLINGTPATNASLVGVPDKDANTLSIQNLLDVRDKRLSIITDPYVYYMGMTWARAGATGMNSSSGFGVAKYDNVLLPINARNMSSQNYTCAPIYWLSYIALNYAEAKAELGQFDQTAYNLSIKKLYERAGLPFTGPADLAAVNDPQASADGVSSLIYEIRRCRNCELMFDENFRFYDLVRWHQLQKLDSQINPDCLRGAYIANAPTQPGSGGQDAEGFYKAYNTNRTFNYKYYLQPIPSGQLDLNPQLGQNPGW